MGHLVTFVILLLLAGCQTARVAHPLTAGMSANDPATQLSFWQTLATRPVTSNDEAFHGLLLFTDGYDPAGSYADRVTLLKSRRMLPGGFDAPAERAITRGDLAVAVCRILDIKGGVMMHLTGGTSPRYAVRELQAAAIYPPSSPNQTFSGMDFLGIIAQMEDQQRGDMARVPAAVMPPDKVAAIPAAPATRPAEKPEQPVADTTQPSLLSIANWAAAVADEALAVPEQPATAPASPASPASQALKATITAVEGIVRVRNTPDEAWRPAQVGMVLGEGAEFQTGPKSAVQFKLPPDQTVTLDRLGAVSILDAIRRGGGVKTDLGMKFGRVRYAIEAAGISHDSTIHSPGSTLAVRGTITSLTNQPPFKPIATSITGRVRFTDLSGQTIEFGGKNTFEEVASGTDGPAFTALNQTYVDPVAAFGRTSTEKEFALNNPLVGSFTPSTGLASVTLERPATVIPPPPSPAGTASGSLIFFLAFAPSTPTNALTSMDLSVVSPLGEVLSVNGPRTVPSGGQAPTHDPGTRGFGEETAGWPASFPLGTYTYSATHVTGGPGEFALAIFRDGQLVSSPNIGTLSSSDPLASFTVNVTANGGTLAAIRQATAAAKPTRPMIPLARPLPMVQPMGPLPVKRAK